MKILVSATSKYLNEFSNSKKTKTENHARFIRGCLFIIVTTLMLTLTACSTNPVYYSKSEVLDYARSIIGDEVELTGELEYPDRTEDKNTMYEYIFIDKNGVLFSVFTHSSRISFDASVTNFYKKNIYDDYVESVVEYHSNTIDKVFNDYGIEYEFLYDDLYLYLYDYEEIDTASQALAEIDGILALEYDFDSYDPPSNNKLEVTIKLKPDSPDEEIVGDEWKNDYSYTIAYIYMSLDAEHRHTKEQIFTDIEREFVYDVRSDSSPEYILPYEILYKYPAQHILLTGGALYEDPEDEFEFYFEYDEDDDKYWIDMLDPCQESMVEYNYFDKGSFKHLVEALGGEYTSQDKRASWQINGASFEAELFLDKQSYYRHFEVSKDGEKLSLDDDDGKGNGTVSGRAFSIEDLEKMLNCDIIIDNVSSTAVVD